VRSSREMGEALLDCDGVVDQGDFERVLERCQRFGLIFFVVVVLVLVIFLGAVLGRVFVVLDVRPLGLLLALVCFFEVQHGTIVRDAGRTVEIDGEHDGVAHGRERDSVLAAGEFAVKGQKLGGFPRGALDRALDGLQRQRADIYNFALLEDRRERLGGRVHRLLNDVVLERSITWPSPR
jgi:hypothetical protein